MFRRSIAHQHNQINQLKVEEEFCDRYSLTPREREVLRLVVDGLSNEEIAHYDLMLCYGLGSHIFTNKGGDRLLEDQDLPFVGHTAEAYGLLGGMGFDFEKGNGIVYIVAGLGSDMDEYYGNYSSFYGWEEQLMTMAGELAAFDY